MTAAEALAVHQRVQDAYVTQLTELNGDHPDLDRCTRLAADIDSALATLPSPLELLQFDLDTRQSLIAAARQSAKLLECSRAALLAQRERLLDAQSHANRSDGALRAYQPPNALPSAHFLDERL